MKKKLSENELKKVLGGALAHRDKRDVKKVVGKPRGHAGHTTVPPRDAGSRPSSWTL